jgi:hypothetical protein
VEWLTDSDFEAARCGICKGDLIEGNVLRLMCLGAGCIFGPRGLTDYLASRSLSPRVCGCVFQFPSPSYGKSWLHVSNMFGEFFLQVAVLFFVMMSSSSYAVQKPMFPPEDSSFPLG